MRKRWSLRCKDKPRCNINRQQETSRSFWVDRKLRYSNSSWWWRNSPSHKIWAISKVVSTVEHFLKIVSKDLSTKRFCRVKILWNYFRNNFRPTLSLSLSDNATTGCKAWQFYHQTSCSWVFKPLYWNCGDRSSLITFSSVRLIRNVA